MGSFAGPSQDIEMPIVPRRSTRQRFSSQQLESPYATGGAPILVLDSELESFRSYLNGDDVDVTIPKSNAPLSKHSFTNILKMDFRLPQEAIELFILSCQSKLIRRVSIPPFISSENTVIASFDFYRQCEQYWARCFFGIRLNQTIPGTYDSFVGWILPETVLAMVKGENRSPTVQNWFSATQIIVPCLIDGHYVVVRVCPGTWEAELYDPSYYGLDEERKLRRGAAIQPLLSLFGYILEQAGYWTSNKYGWERKTHPLQLYIPGPDNQFSQKNYSDGGPFACMVIERIISGAPSITWGNTRVKKYRKIIAASIFSMCIVD